MPRGKCFELIDVVKFALPNVLRLEAAATSYNLAERVAGGGFMSYGAMWSRIDVLVSGRASDDFVETTFSFYQDDWKNEQIREAYRLLRDRFGGKGRWYGISHAPIYVLGFWFKPSIKGIWFHDGKAYAVLVNPRKRQALTDSDVRFLARGVYDLHCIDDPNDPTPLIVDLSQHDGDKGRKARIYEVRPDEAVSLEAFEYSIREFIAALNIAGVSLPPPPEVEHILDLFRRPGR
jgi:hypothetical protein